MLAVAVLIVPALAVLAGCGHSDSSPAPRAPAPPPLVSSRPVLAPPVTPGTRYRHLVEDEIAARLHLTLAAAAAQLRAAPGSTLMNLAKPNGLAEDQLASIILSTLNHADTQAVQSGAWTAIQAQDEKQFWASQPIDSLITGISEWYLQT
jgi:hypothetical protein